MAQKLNGSKLRKVSPPSLSSLAEMIDSLILSYSYIRCCIIGIWHIDLTPPIKCHIKYG